MWSEFSMVVVVKGYAQFSTAYAGFHKHERWRCEMKEVLYVPTEFAHAPMVLCFQAEHDL